MEQSHSFAIILLICVFPCQALENTWRTYNKYFARFFIRGLIILIIEWKFIAPIMSGPCLDWMVSIWLSLDHQRMKVYSTDYVRNPCLDWMVSTQLSPDQPHSMCELAPYCLIVVKRHHTIEGIAYLWLEIWKPCCLCYTVRVLSTHDGHWHWQSKEPCQWVMAGTA